MSRPHHPRNGKLAQQQGGCNVLTSLLDLWNRHRHSLWCTGNTFLPLGAEAHLSSLPQSKYLSPPHRRPAADLARAGLYGVRRRSKREEEFASFSVDLFSSRLSLRGCATVGSGTAQLESSRPCSIASITSPSFAPTTRSPSGSMSKPWSWRSCRRFTAKREDRSSWISSWAIRI